MDAEKPWWHGTEYEVCDPIVDAEQRAALRASYTPNNGIRLHIEDRDDEGVELEPAEFDLSDAQALWLSDKLKLWASSRATERTPKYNKTIERVARAICIAQGDDDPDREWHIGDGGMPFLEWHDYIPEAKAAISAIFEGCPALETTKAPPSRS